jgi:hypothetical protein
VRSTSRGTGWSPSLIDLDTGRRISTAAAIRNIDNVYGHLVSNHGRLLVIGVGDTQLTFTELPTTPVQGPVIQAGLTPDGGRAVSELEDGTRLQLRSVSRAASASTPTPSPTRGLITQSGTRIEEWNPRTGRRLAGFDASVFHPRVDQQGTLQFAVLVHDDSLVHLVDLRTGRLTAGSRVTADAIAVQFDRSGRYFALMRHGSVVELWRSHPLRREPGPFPSVDQPWVGRFIDERGRFLLAANGVIRIYRIGHRAYPDSYNPGPADEAASTDYTFVDTSADGRTVLIVNADGTGRPLVLDPRAWRRDLCRIIGYRDFTPAERSASPVRIPAGPVCG